MQINANLPLTCFRGKGGNWVGVCEPMKLTIQGATWGELLEEFNDTLNAMLTDLLQTNELDAFLRDKGWLTVGQLPRHDGGVQFDVPFTPIMMPTPDSGAHGQPEPVHQ